MTGSQKEQQAIKHNSVNHIPVNALEEMEITPIVDLCKPYRIMGNDYYDTNEHLVLAGDETHCTRGGLNPGKSHVSEGYFYNCPGTMGRGRMYG